jgi:drug/metabolite transporter (DMT)-like permease
MLVHHGSGVRHFGRPGNLLNRPFLNRPLREAEAAIAGERRRQLRAIALMCGACALFSCLDASAKYLVQSMDALQIVWARYLSAFIVAFIVSNPVTRPGLLNTRRPLLQIGRSALLLSSTALNFFALRYLQLDQALAIMFSTPFFVTVFSALVLNEWVGWRRFVAVGVGFVGVLLVARPGTASGLHPAALLCLGGAVCYAFYNISTRVLSRTDSNQTTLFYSNLVGAAAMMPVLPFVWRTPESPLVCGLLLTTGVFGSVGHYLLIAAHRLASASVLAPFIYIQLIWATLWGYLLFHHVPDRLVLAGAAIVIASGLYILYRAHKLPG